MAEDAEASPRIVRKLILPRFKAADTIRNVWGVVPEAGVTVDDLLAKDYWSHVANRLRPGDQIEAYAEDGSYYARLYVKAASRLEAVVKLLEKLDLGTAEAEPIEADLYEPKWKGPQHRWAVIRRADGDIIKSGFEGRDGAANWIANHVKAMAA